MACALVRTEHNRVMVSLYFPAANSMHAPGIQHHPAAVGASPTAILPHSIPCCVCFPPMSLPGHRIPPPAGRARQRL